MLGFAAAGNTVSDPLDLRNEQVEAFLQCARSGQASSVKGWLDGGHVSPNSRGTKRRNSGWTALHLSSYFGHIDVVKVLIEAGANVNSQNNQGDSALHKAVLTGREAVVGTLLAAGADPFLTNTDGYTALRLSTSSSISVQLRKAHLDVQTALDERLRKAAQRGDASCIHDLLSQEHHPNIDSQDRDGNTALHHAAAQENIEAVKALREFEANSFISNCKGQIPEDMTSCSVVKASLTSTLHHMQVSPPPIVQGALVKLSRLLREEIYWVLLDHGILSWYRSKEDALFPNKAISHQTVRGIEAAVHDYERKVFVLTYSNGVKEAWWIPFGQETPSPEDWVTSVHAHAKFSTAAGVGRHKASHRHLHLWPMPPDFPPVSLHRHLSTVSSRYEELMQSSTELDQHAGHRAKVVSKADLKALQDSVDQLLSHAHQLLSSLHSAASALEGQALHIEFGTAEPSARSQSAPPLTIPECDLRTEVCAVLGTTTPCRHKSSISSTQTSDDSFFDAVSELCLSMSPTTSQPGTVVDHARSLVVASDQTDSSVQQHESVWSYPNFGEDRTVRRSYTQAGPLDDAKYHIVQCRTQLPSPMLSSSKFGIWESIKQGLGTDLSSLVIPIIYNEPVSFLQRMAEGNFYVPMLDRFATHPDPLERMKAATADALSLSAVDHERTGKPFIPLLGETFELVRSDLGYKVVLEQVSCDPPVTAGHIQGRHFEISCHVQTAVKIGSQGVVVQPVGVTTVTIPQYDEVYSYSFVATVVHNVLVGKMWTEHTGELTVTNHANGMKASVNYKPAGWSGRDLNHVEGVITDKSGAVCLHLAGKWHEQVYCSRSPIDLANVDVDKVNIASAVFNGVQSHFNEAVPSDGTNVGDAQDVGLLWRAVPRPKCDGQYYGMSEFGMGLNELSSSLASILPPSDSRFRKDIRYMEEGDYERAGREKSRLVTVQKEFLHQLKAEQKEWEPRWFKKGLDSTSGQETWRFTGEYWNRDFLHAVGSNKHTDSLLAHSW